MRILEHEFYEFEAVENGKFKFSDKRGQDVLYIAEGYVKVDKDLLILFGTRDGDAVVEFTFATVRSHSREFLQRISEAIRLHPIIPELPEERRIAKQA